MLDLREFRKHPDRLTDVLPWAALVAPDVVLNKDGSFQSTIAYRGPDLDSSTPEELIVNTAHLNNVLRRLGSGWAIYAEAQRTPAINYPRSSFPDPISTMIDEQRRRRYESGIHHESRYFLSVIWLPPSQTTSKAANLFLRSADADGINYELLLDSFRSEVNRVVDLMSRVFPQASLLAGDDVLTYLHSTISIKSHRVAMPEVPMYLDALLADTSLLGGFHPRLGDHFLTAVAVLGFPGTSQPAVLDAFNHLPIAYRWITRFICLDKVQAKREIESFQRKWFAKRKGITALLKELLTKEESALSDTDALQKAEDSQAALIELGTDDVSFGYCSTTFILSSPDPDNLRSISSEVERLANGAGFTSISETVNAVDSWLGTIPGNTRNNVRRPLLNTVNLAHLFPGASAIWDGQERNEHLDGPPLLVADTAGTTPFRLSTHIGDVGHMLVLGPTGSGKSTLLNFIEVQFLRYPEAQVYIFDKGGSALTLTTALGGDYYNLGDENSDLAFQPLASVDDDAERKWAHDWLLAIAASENVLVTPDIKRTVWDALGSLAATPKKQRTLEALTVYLQNILLRTAFEPYTRNGAHGQLLDRESDNLQYGRWQVFEMERLMQSPAVIGPVLAYLFHRLDRRFTGAPSLLVLDEAWLFLDHAVFSSKIREWLKTLRKRNVAVIFATQSLTDIDSSAIAATIKEACFTKIYLPNSVALQPDAAEFYRRFGLNDRQIEMLAHSLPKRDYYYTSPLGNRLFDLGLDELALAYCAGATKEQLKTVREIRSAAIDTLDFNIRYLRHRHLGWAASELEALRNLKDAA